MELICMKEHWRTFVTFFGQKISYNVEKVS